MKRIWSVVGLGWVLVAACGGGPPAAAGSQSPPPSAAAVQGGPATVQVAGSALGQILVDGSGRTLYEFAADTHGQPSCYGSCAQLWPPLLTHGAPVAASGARSSLVGTAARTDGSTQVSYAGHPLYYWVGDHQPGQLTGQAVNNSGGLWYVLAPDGTPITKAP